MLSRSFTKFAARPVLSACNFKLQQALLSSGAFEAAVAASTKLSADPGNDVKLEMYALYKQATAGKCNAKKPGMLDIVGKAKWQAWSGLGDMTKEEAEKRYISLVEELQEADKAEVASSDSSDSAPGEDTSIEGVAISLVDRVMTFRLNTPRQKNPLSMDVYQAIPQKLEEAAADPNCRVVVFTGTGDYFSSGNDLKSFQKLFTSKYPDQPDKNPMAISAGLARMGLSNFQRALIDFPKPIVALVNGPAVGIMVTTLALCDAVLASETATFTTPFTKLAQSPEGCSTLTFPLIMGPLVASDVLLFGRILNAKEAAHHGLVSRVLPADEFANKSAEFVKYVASLPPGCLQASKKLLRGNSGQQMSIDILRKVSDAECSLLEKLWQSEECATALANFAMRKK